MLCLIQILKLRQNYLKEHNVKVEVKEINPWRFDVARNESLKLVPDDANILVCTDLDEILDALVNADQEDKMAQEAKKYND